MSLPAAAAPTNLFSGGCFEGLVMSPEAPFVQPVNAWMVYRSAAGQIFGIESYDIDGAGMLLVQGLRWGRSYSLK